jgi:phosphoglycolate phosphatase-like HAD superfamily hydrolase
MRVLAFDFDGVLCDSSRELFVVAVDALAGIEPDSTLLSRLAPLRDEALAGGNRFRENPLYQQFSDLLPLGNRAEDFGVALRAMEGSKTISDQAQYDGFYAELPVAWRDRFHLEFYAARGRLRESDPGRWMALHLPYPDLVAALERHRGKFLMAVATAKDSPSVHLLLAELGLKDLIDSRLILDKETGVEKTVHLRELQRRTGTPFHDITFVDDKLNHLVKVASLGVRCVLAGWGFNTDRERVTARRLGFAVARLDDLDRTVFKGA